MALVLSRKPEEEIVFEVPSHGLVTIKVFEVRGSKTKLGITAPAGIIVHRKEVYDKIQNAPNNHEATESKAMEVAEVSEVKQTETKEKPESCKSA
jgi:carbon storage regulator CsrA